MSLALVAVHNRDEGASWCIVSDDTIISQEDSSVGDEGATVILDEVIVFTSAGHVTASSEPAQFA